MELGVGGGPLEREIKGGLTGETRGRCWIQFPGNFGDLASWVSSVSPQ